MTTKDNKLPLGKHYCQYSKCLHYGKAFKTGEMVVMKPEKFLFCSTECKEFFEKENKKE